jgi:hypothetical protein
MNVNQAARQVIGKIAWDYWSVSRDSSYGLPAPTEAAGNFFVKGVLDCILAGWSRAMEAARDCDIRVIDEDKSAFQAKLYAGLRDFLPQLWRPHPRNDDKARAGAEVLVAKVPPWVERRLFKEADRKAGMSEFELQEEEAREEDESAGLIQRRK